MAIERVLEAYVRRERSFPDGSVLRELDVEHEEGWSNDSGTAWPASVSITWRTLPPGAGPKARGRRQSMYVSDDPVEFMRELFVLADTLDAPILQEGGARV